jgi:hypothetical protein
MTTINKQVGASSDDCKNVQSSGADISSTTIVCGGHTTPGPAFYDGCFRWTSVNVPQGATIETATLSLYLTIDQNPLLTGKGIDEDNTGTFVENEDIAARTQTTASVDADEAAWGNWGVGNWITLEVKTLVEEIVGRGGWSANNALAIILLHETSGANDNMTVRAYDYAGNAHGAKLDITYSSVSSKNTRSTMNVHPGVMFGVLTGGHGY